MHRGDSRLCRRLRGREQVAVPVLAPRIWRPDEQDLAPRPVPRHQHEHGFGLRHARQVEEIAVLPVLVVDVT
jgi:hypothetical protein